MEKSLTCADKLREVADGVLPWSAAIAVLQAAREEINAMELEACQRLIADAESLRREQKADAEIAGKSEGRAALMALVLEWEQSARSQLRCAERTTDPMGKRLVQHGGMCYFNCAQAIRRYLFEA